MLDLALPKAVKKKVQFAEAAGHELIHNTAVPKSRKPKFELIFKLIYLNNVPLVTGACYVKWHLPSSTAVEHRGKTHRAPIKDHLVTWDYETRVELRMIVDKKGELEAADIQFEIVQDYAVGAKGERALLGVVRLNLAEYVLACDEMEEAVCRRYLMQESKINSTVKISIFIRQIEGDKNFVAPPLKTAPIFGNISGVLNFEQGERDESGHLTSVSSKANRDIHEMRAIYRQTLTAVWSAQGDELPADECIEDIFAGGDGYGHAPNGRHARRHRRRRRRDASDESADSATDEDDDEDRTPTPPPSSRRETEHTPRPAPRPHHAHRGSSYHSHFGRPGHHRHQSSKSSERTIGRSRNDKPNATSSSSDDRREDEEGTNAQRLTEADIREDMRTWNIRTEVLPP